MVFAFFDDEGWQFGKTFAVQASCKFIDDLPQAEDVGCRGTRAFRWNISGSAKIGVLLAAGLQIGDQADVGEFGSAVHENDVRRLDIAMDKLTTVKMIEGSA